MVSSGRLEGKWSYMGRCKGSNALIEDVEGGGNEDGEVSSGYWRPGCLARMVQHGLGVRCRGFFWIYIALCELVNKKLKFT